MASAKIFRINYKSDFILTLESDAGWMTPFCIKFWTGAPSQAYYVGWDGEAYNHCSFDPSEPTKLQVQFDDHHLPIGDLKYQVAYHFTVADFPNDTEDEVINPANITTEIDGETYHVMLDFTGETAPEIEFSLPAYANEAQRIANEQQRIAAETQRIANEETRIANEQTRINQEQTRQQNEQQRINQEQARVNEYASLKADAVAATVAANDAAALANQKAQLAADKAALAQSAANLANAKAQLAADKAALAASAAQLANDKAALAQQKAEYAQTQGGYAKDQGDYAKDQGDYAKAQGDTALADHQRAEADHGIAVDDHTQAGNDHTRAESDHGIAADDHTQAGNDHTRAESDHGIAVDDHTRAESDHGIAADDHTQAGNDHTRAESDHTRAESDHAAVELYVDSLGVFDLSKHNAVGGVLATYADLSAALTALNALESKYKYGGMSFKFVQTSDNKYVQFMYVGTSTSVADFTNVANWELDVTNKTLSNDFMGILSEIKDFTIRDYAITAQGKYGTSTTYKHGVIPVTEGEIYYIICNTSGRGAFCTSDESSSGANVPFVSGTTVINIPFGQYSKLVIPEGCTYLIFNAGDYYGTRCFKHYDSLKEGTDEYTDTEPIEDSPYLITSGAVAGALSELDANFDEEVTELKNEIEENFYDKERIPTADYPITHLYIDANNVWKYTDRNESKVLPITPGKTYIVSYELTSFIALLKSFDDEVDVDGATPDFCDNYQGRIRVEADVPYTFIAPVDANYVVLRCYSSAQLTYVKFYEMTSKIDILNEEIDVIKENLEMTGDTTKILIVGDSWGRDIATELWSAAHDMDIDLFVAQPYQGGSGLYNQFKGMDDATRHYTHGNFEQYTQGTYQLLEYNSGSPVKTPSTGYNNGKCGVYDGIAWGKDANSDWAAKTLAECIASQDWDIILIRLHCSDLQNIEGLTTTDDSKGYFDINDFIARMEQELTPTSLAKVKWGIATTWSWPEEAALTYTPGQSTLIKLNIPDWSALTDDQKQAVFAQLYPNIQKNFQLVCNHIGNKLSYAVNIAKAIQLARKSYWLKDVAWHMNRSSTDMHLGNGIPKYICALTILYSIFRRTDTWLKLNYIPDLSDGSGDTSDGGTESNPTTPTRALCIGSNNVSWQACCEMPDSFDLT